MTKEEVEFNEVTEPWKRVKGMDISKYAEHIPFELFPVIEYIVEIESMLDLQHEGLEHLIGLVNHYEQRLGIENKNAGRMSFEDFHKAMQEHRAKEESQDPED